MPTRFLALAAGIFLIASALRLVYFFSAEVANPIAGDINQYVAYAWNLRHHGVFSSAPPGSAVVAPDAFRGPGYPSLLALSMRVAGDHWYGWAVGAQLFLGSLLAPLTVAWTRLWLPQCASLIAGLGVALWPHLIVQSSTLLSETVFGTALLLFLVCAAFAERDGRKLSWALLAGMAGGFAYLVNPVAVFLPFIAVLLLVVRRQRRVAVIILTVHLLFVGGWWLRNAAHPHIAGAWDRAAINLVEGSWPLYHAAYNARRQEPMAQAVMDAIAEEEQLMARDPAAGLKSIAARLSAEPSAYARWYFLEKPWSLWSWWVRIGWGDVYFLQTARSPFDRLPVFRAIHAVFRYANPVLFGLALSMAVVALVRRSRYYAPGAFPLLMAAAFFFYVTAIHNLLQADPRYAVAYRPMQLALAVTAILAAWRWWAARKASGVLVTDEVVGVRDTSVSCAGLESQLAEVRATLRD